MLHSRPIKGLRYESIDSALSPDLFRRNITNEEAGSRKAEASRADHFEHISAYMRHVALLYWEDEEELLKARANSETEAAEMYQHSVERLETEIKIDLDSDLCETTHCGLQSALMRASDQSFFFILQLTRHLADQLNTRLRYDGSSCCYIPASDTDAQYDQALVDRFLDCRLLVTAAIDGGSFNTRDKCLSTEPSLEIAAQSDAAQQKAAQMTREYCEQHSENEYCQK